MGVDYHYKASITLSCISYITKVRLTPITEIALTRNLQIINRRRILSTSLPKDWRHGVACIEENMHGGEVCSIAQRTLKFAIAGQ